MLAFGRAVGNLGVGVKASGHVRASIVQYLSSVCSIFGLETAAFEGINSSLAMTFTPVPKKRAHSIALDAAWEADGKVAKKCRKRCDPSLKRQVQKAITDNLKSLCSYQIDCLV
eukprot:2455316-Amphidinium_carterae.1